MSLLEYINKKNRSCAIPFMGTNGLFLTGYTIYEVYNSPEKQLEVAKIMDKYFSSDFIYPMDDGNIFCETLGVPLIKPDYDFSSVEMHIIKDIEILKKYEVPNPYNAGRMPTNLKSLNLIANNFNKPLFVSLQGPFTLACQIAGVELVAKSIIKNPEFVEKLTDFTTETIIKYANAIEKQGVKYISIAEPFSSIISPKAFKKFVYPKLKELYNNINCWKGIHICGKIYHLLDMLYTVGVESISLDQIMDLKQVSKDFPKDKVLIGNIDPINILKNMTREEVKKETLKLKEQMKPMNNYIMSFGCTCLNDTPVENLQAFLDGVYD